MNNLSDFASYYSMILPNIEILPLFELIMLYRVRVLFFMFSILSILVNMFFSNMRLSERHFLAGGYKFKT